MFMCDIVKLEEAKEFMSVYFGPDTACADFLTYTDIRNNTLVYTVIPTLEIPDTDNVYVLYFDFMKFEFCLFQNGIDIFLDVPYRTIEEFFAQKDGLQ